MNKKVCIVTMLVAILAATVVGAESETEVISNSFIFIDGRYLDAPYIVNDNGFSVLINGIPVLNTRYCPPCLEKAKDVALPKSITADSTMYDEDVRTYLSGKLLYFSSLHYPKKEIIRRMAEVYKELPCVENAVVWKDPEVLVITWRGDEPIHTRLFGVPGGGRLSREGVERVRKITQRYREYFMKRLKDGYCYMFFKQDGFVTVAPQDLRSVFFPLIRILQSSGSTQEKIQKIKVLGLEEIEVQEFQAVVTDFSASEQLGERISRFSEAKDGKSGFLHGISGGTTLYLSH